MIEDYACSTVTPSTATPITWNFMYVVIEVVLSKMRSMLMRDDSSSNAQIQKQLEDAFPGKINVIVGH